MISKQFPVQNVQNVKPPGSVKDGGDFKGDHDDNDNKDDLSGRFLTPVAMLTLLCDLKSSVAAASAASAVSAPVTGSRRELLLETPWNKIWLALAFLLFKQLAAQSTS